MWPQIQVYMARVEAFRERVRERRFKGCVSAGVSFPISGEALGPTSSRTTQRHAHLGDDPVREAVALTGALIGDVVKGT